MFDFLPTSLFDPIIAGDPAIQTLRVILGDLVPGGSLSVLSKLAKTFNAIVFAAAAIFLMYNVAVGVLQTAHEGSVLGNRWSSLWSPIRVVFAGAMLVPLENGFTLLQKGIAFVAIGSAAFGNTMSNAALDALVSDKLPLTAPIIVERDDWAKQALEQLYCYYSYNYDADIRGGKQVKYVPIDKTTVEETSTFDRLFGFLKSGFNASEDNLNDAAGKPRVIRRVGYTFDGTAASDLYPQVCGSLILEFQSTSVSHSKEISKLHQDALFKALGWDRDGGLDDLALKLVQRNREANGHEIHVTPREANLVAETYKADIRSIDQRLRALKADPVSVDEDLMNLKAGGWMTIGSLYQVIADVNSKNLDLANIAPQMERPIPEAQKQWEIWKVGNWYDANRQIAAREADITNISAANATNVGPVLDEVLPIRKILPDIFTGDLFATAFRQGTGAVFDFSDPMSRIATLGDLMLSGSTAGFAGLAAIKAAVYAGGSNIIASSSGFGGAAIAVYDLAERIMIPFLSFLVIFGGFFTVIIPLLPVVVTLTAVLGWLISVIEGILAAPLFAAAHMRMDGEGLSGGLDTGYKLLLNIFLRPPLIVIGFLSAHLIFSAIGQLALYTFGLTASSIFSVDPVANLIKFFFLTGFLIVVLWQFAISSFSLTWQLPNKVLAYIDSLPGGGEEEGNYGKAVAAGSALTYGSGGHKLGGGLGKLSGNAGAATGFIAKNRKNVAEGRSRQSFGERTAEVQKKPKNEE